MSLLGAFELTADAIPLALQGSSQRLVAFLGVRDRTVPRSVVAGTLWPEAPEAHARASLRTLLSRLDEATRNALRVNVLDLSLAEGVELDLRDSRALANRLLIVDVDSGIPTSARRPSRRSPPNCCPIGTTTGPRTRLLGGMNSACVRSRRWRKS